MALVSIRHLSSASAVHNDLFMDSRPQAAVVDIPTMALALGIYLSFGLLTWFHHALPWWVVAPLGGYLVALHGSLLHEATHGYPSRVRWITEATVFPVLWLWLPFRSYRETHLTHHRDEQLTCPLSDPESNFVTPSIWAAMGPGHRSIRRALTTLAGRLVIGPPYVVWRTGCRIVAAVEQKNSAYLAQWLGHVPAVALVLFWVVAVCRIPLWQYVLLYVYPGLSLTLLRSYAEHRPARPTSERTATVRTNPLMAFLYTFNNLHALHHAEPATAWYRRPARYRLRREELDRANGGYVIEGYGELFRRYLFAGKEPPMHPLAGQGFPI
jgi:fatty acid desaturase